MSKKKKKKTTPRDKEVRMQEQILKFLEKGECFTLNVSVNKHIKMSSAHTQMYGKEIS